MRVIVSWSGQPSHEAALELYRWLPQVLAGVEPWISSEDIASGSGWFSELKEALDGADAAIICVTPSNLHSEWMHYEAGAVAAKVTKPFVCPYLLGVEASDLASLPLQQHQCRVSTKDGTLKLIRDINRAFGDGRVPENLIEGNFETRWPEFKEKLDGIELESPEELAVEHPMFRAKPLSEEAKTLLVEASNDAHGHIMMIYTSGGLTLQTNGKQMAEQKNARSEATWRGAVYELVETGYFEARGHKGEVFAITRAGYEKADELKNAE